MFWSKRMSPSCGLWEACRSTYENACISATRRPRPPRCWISNRSSSKLGGGAIAKGRRIAVRQAKDRLRLVLRGGHFSPEKKEVKQELLRWFLVWLETPELFSQWLELRRGAKTQR